MNNKLRTFALVAGKFVGMVGAGAVLVTALGCSSPTGATQPKDPGGNTEQPPTPGAVEPYAGTLKTLEGSTVKDSPVAERMIISLSDKKDTDECLTQKYNELKAQATDLKSKGQISGELNVLTAETTIIAAFSDPKNTSHPVSAETSVLDAYTTLATELTKGPQGKRVNPDLLKAYRDAKYLDGHSTSVMTDKNKRVSDLVASVLASGVLRDTPLLKSNATIVELVAALEDRLIREAAAFRSIGKDNSKSIIQQLGDYEELRAIVNSSIELGFYGRSLSSSIAPSQSVAAEETLMTR